ncbi:MAG: LCP family protein [Oscillospiraceae bacterium]|nr:LCP family protein [Oscillospiraceae bacterium]
MNDNHNIWSDTDSEKKAGKSKKNNMAVSNDIFSSTKMKNKNKGKPKKKRTAKELALIITSIVAIAASLATLGFLGAMYVWEGSLFAGGEGSLNNPNANEDVTYFLVLGIDYEPGTDRGQLSDVTMMVCLDHKAKTMNFLQLPRDAYVGELASSGKINAIYGAGVQTRQDGREGRGVQGVAYAFEEMFKINIDHYVVMQMDQFRDIVDSLGGVEVDVPKTVSYRGVTVPGGKQQLTGKQAEILVRVRKAYPSGDYGRMDAQRAFMAGMFKKLFTMKKSEMAAKARELFKFVKTDLSLKQIDYFSDEVKKVKEKDVKFFTAGGAAGRINGLSSILLAQNELCDMLNENFRPYMEKYTVEQLNIRGDNYSNSYYASVKSGLVEEEEEETGSQ